MNTIAIGDLRIELHPAYLAKIACSMLAGFLGINVLVSVVTAEHHWGFTGGQFLSALVLAAYLAVPFFGLSRLFRHLIVGVPVVLVGAAAMTFLMVSLTSVVYHLPGWIGVAGALLLLGIAVVFGSAHPSDDAVDAEIDRHSLWAQALPRLAWGWPIAALLASAVALAFDFFL